MARLVPSTTYYSVLEDLLEHLFRPEIQYLEAEEDVPNLIELRDVFCVDDSGKTYYIYLKIGDTTGFVSIAEDAGFDDMIFVETDVTSKPTQAEAKTYLLSLIPD